MKSVQTVMMVLIFWQMKVLKRFWMHPLKVVPVLLYHLRKTSTAQRSSEVPDPWDKWEDVDLASCCVFDEMPLETCDDEMSSRPIDFVGSSADDIDYATEFLKGYSTLKQLLSADLPDDCNDANSIWSILTDRLLYCQSDTSDSVRYFSYDSLKAKSAKQRFFDAALNNEPYSNTAYFVSCNIEYCNDKDLYRD